MGLKCSCVRNLICKDDGSYSSLNTQLEFIPRKVLSLKNTNIEKYDESPKSISLSDFTIEKA